MLVDVSGEGLDDFEGFERLGNCQMFEVLKVVRTLNIFKLVEVSES